MLEAAYHSGEPPDSRTMSTLEDNNITDYEHLARRVSRLINILWDDQVA